MTLTPFSLSYTFTQGAQPKMEEIDGMALPSGYLLDSQGMARRAGSASGGGGNWGTTFRTPLDLTTVSAVEVAGYVVPLGQGTAVPENWDAQATEQAAWDRVFFYFGLDPADYTYVNYRADRMEICLPGGDPGPAVDPPNRHGGGRTSRYSTGTTGRDLWYALLRQGENYHLYTLQRNPDLPADSGEVTQCWVQAEPMRTLPVEKVPAVEPVTLTAAEERGLTPQTVAKTPGKLAPTYGK